MLKRIDMRIPYKDGITRTVKRKLKELKITTDQIISINQDDYCNGEDVTIWYDTQR